MATRTRAAQWSTEEVNIYMDPKSSLKPTLVIRTREKEETQEEGGSWESLALSTSSVVSPNAIQHYLRIQRLAANAGGAGSANSGSSGVSSGVL